jgi:hypothetical protein
MCFIFEACFVSFLRHVLQEMFHSWGIRYPSYLFLSFGLYRY